MVRERTEDTIAKAKAARSQNKAHKLFELGDFIISADKYQFIVKSKKSKRIVYFNSFKSLAKYLLNQQIRESEGIKTLKDILEAIQTWSSDFHTFAQSNSFKQTDKDITLAKISA